MGGQRHVNPKIIYEGHVGSMTFGKKAHGKHVGSVDLSKSTSKKRLDLRESEKHVGIIERLYDVRSLYVAPLLSIPQKHLLSQS